MSVWPIGQISTDRKAALNRILNGTIVRQVVVYVAFVKTHRLMIENYLDADMLDLNRDQLDNIRPGSDLNISFSIEDQIRHLTERLNVRKQELDEFTDKMQALMPQIDLDPWKTRP